MSRTISSGPAPGMTPLNDAAPAPPGAACDPAPAPAPAAWPDLDATQVGICKKLADGLPVFKCVNLGKTFVVRPVRAHEWRALLERWRAAGEASTQASEDEDLCRAAVLWPQVPSFGALEAGHPAALAAVVREKSGFPALTEAGLVGGEGLSVTALGAGEAPAFPAPTPADVEGARALSPTGRLVRADVPRGPSLLVAPITRAAWRDLQAAAKADPGADSTVLAVRAAVVWPADPDLESLPAGHVERLFDLALEQSGFGEVPQVSEL